MRGGESGTEDTVEEEGSGGLEERAAIRGDRYVGVKVGFITCQAPLFLRLGKQSRGKKTRERVVLGGSEGSGEEGGKIRELLVRDLGWT